MLRRCSIALLSALAVLAFAAPQSLAADARYEGISADGSVAFFSTTDKLVPGDTDTRRDLYERSYDGTIEGYVTRQVSFGPKGGNNAFDVQFQAATADGVQVFFSTGERLTSEDKDSATDIYVRDLDLNKTTLVSAGDPSCAGAGCGSANSAVSAVAGGVAAGGDVVFFASEERLSTADSDGFADVYARDVLAGTTTLVSEGGTACVPSGCGDGSVPAFFQGASSDGTKAFFTTAEKLTGGDTDTLTDLYERDLEAGETRLVSTQGICPAGVDCSPIFGGNSADGSHVFFESSERIAGEDLDSQQDVYDWSDGTAVLASRGLGGVNGPFNALYAGSSADGGAVFVATEERLDAVLDIDEAQDVYARIDGASTALVSAGEAGCLPGCGNGDFPASLRWISSDGAIALFSSQESLASADADGAFDLYRRELPGGPTTLVSQADPSCSAPECGNAALNANFAAASADASHVFLVTAEPLVDADADTQIDVYDRSGGGTALVSTGPINGNGPHGAQLQGASSDGAHAFFVTKERLTGEDDFAGEEDVYVRSASGTLLVSAENDPELDLGPPPPQLQSTDPPSPGASTEPRIVGFEAESAADIKIYTSPDCSGEPVATGSAEELADPGIAVTVAPGSTTAFRATAEAEGFASACSSPLSYQQQNPTPPPPPPPPGGGSGDGTGGSSGSGGGGAAGGSGGGTGGGSGGGLVYVTPATRITFAPASRTRARRPVFRFVDSTGQSGTRFRCRIDRRRWTGCKSPTKLKRLRPGRHVFRVRGINAAGEVERRPSKRVFRVVRRR